MRIATELRITVDECTPVPAAEGKLDNGTSWAVPAHFRVFGRGLALGEEKGLVDKIEERNVLLESLQQVPLGPCLLRVYPKLKGQTVKMIVESVLSSGAKAPPTK